MCETLLFIYVVRNLLWHRRLSSPFVYSCTYVVFIGTACSAVYAWPANRVFFKVIYLHNLVRSI
jgi:hypothetical protein